MSFLGSFERGTWSLLRMLKHVPVNMEQGRAEGFKMQSQNAVSDSISLPFLVVGFFKEFAYRVDTM